MALLPSPPCPQGSRAAARSSSPQDWLDALTDPCVVLDAELRVVHANRAFARPMSRAPASLTGQPLADLVPSFEGGPVQGACQDSLVSGASCQALDRRAGHVYQARVYPMGDGVLLWWIDATDHPRPTPDVVVKDNGRGHGVVLIIDDEPHVRDVAARMLRGAGLTVLLASNGREGLEVFRRHQHEIGLILLDLIMPGLDGRHTLAALRQLRPNVKVLLTSGHPLGAEANPHINGFLPKPFALEELCDTVTEVLATA